MLHSKQCIVKSQTREGVKFRLSPVGFVDDDFNDDDNDDKDDNVSLKLSALSLSPVYGRICRGVDAEKLRPGLARVAQAHIGMTMMMNKSSLFMMMAISDDDSSLQR